MSSELIIQIMPSESRAFFDSMKTTSFHITLVVSCKLTGRAGGFKINVWRDGGQKRYEFEADNGKQAGEWLRPSMDFELTKSRDHQLYKTIVSAKIAITNVLMYRKTSYQAEKNTLLPPRR